MDDSDFEPCGTTIVLVFTLIIIPVIVAPVTIIAVVFIFISQLQIKRRTVVVRRQLVNNEM
jgi:hypothetical protein